MHPITPGAWVPKSPAGRSVRAGDKPGGWDEMTPPSSRTWVSPTLEPGRGPGRAGKTVYRAPGVPPATHQGVCPLRLETSLSCCFSRNPQSAPPPPSDLKQAHCWPGSRRWRQIQAPSSEPPLSADGLAGWPLGAPFRCPSACPELSPLSASQDQGPLAQPRSAPGLSGFSRLGTTGTDRCHGCHRGAPHSAQPHTPGPFCHTYILSPHWLL